MAPTGFFPADPNMSRFMPPPPQFNMPAGGNFWNPGMHLLDHVAQMSARIRRLEADYQRLEDENRELRRQVEAENHDEAGAASRTIKKELLELRGIQPIPRTAPDADLIVLAEVRPKIRRYKTIAEVKFSKEYFFENFVKFKLSPKNPKTSIPLYSTLFHVPPGFEVAHILIISNFFLVCSVVSLANGDPNEVAPPAPVAPRAMAPPGFFPADLNMSQFMPPPPPQINMPAGGNFWNPGMHPLDREAQMSAYIKRLEAENRELRRQLEDAKSGGPSAKRGRQDQPGTSRDPGEEKLAKMKQEPANEEKVDFAENNRSSTSRTIKKEPLNPYGIQPISQPAPNADLIVLAEIRPEIRRYKTIAEAIEVAGEEFSTDYFSDKFQKYNLPIAIL
ncbi:hypothetical protein CAEBREN_17595 [Caenorhabditis brenneri]|uniref:Uncharacterized protein n=1 Tax=Caenorhabditis brenneri TaxID=135651 RepID=G0P936_CAEBE|nr:hypothetical protein CAEBREN_17595 [Caenorhabditis brenneri]